MAETRTTSSDGGRSAHGEGGRLPSPMPPAARAHSASTRAPDWESRLSEVLREASLRAFDARTWNCARFAHACAQAVTGRELPYAFRGSLAGSVDELFPRHSYPLAAKRGDVVLGRLPHDTLGVCVGHVAVFLLESKGLASKPLADIAIAWRV
jgi:hypothetical protein